MNLSMRKKLMVGFGVAASTVTFAVVNLFGPAWIALLAAVPAFAVGALATPRSRLAIEATKRLEVSPEAAAVTEADWELGGPRIETDELEGALARLEKRAS